MFPKSHIHLSGFLAQPLPAPFFLLPTLSDTFISLSLRLEFVASLFFIFYLVDSGLGQKL
jgi:hypothetical protein